MRSRKIVIGESPRGLLRAIPYAPVLRVGEMKYHCRMSSRDEKSTRQPIPKALEAKILLECARRCALCFQVDPDLGEKDGQIAHLDRDPANNNEDNLAFFCLRHHSLYDSTTSQHKNYTTLEVKAARKKLTELIAQRKELVASRGDNPAQPTPREADRKTLDDLLRILPSGGGIAFIRGFDFGCLFERARLSDMKEFLSTRRDAPEHEFLDCELETLRKKLLESMSTLLQELSVNTWPLKGSVTHARVPSEWQEKQPERWRGTVQKINEAADETCKNYDALVRAARNRLLN